MSNGKTWRLITVNTAPKRAKRLIGRVAEALQGEYNIEHVDNVTTIDEVHATVAAKQPDLLFCASMWSLEESNEIQRIAKTVVPHIKTYAIPQGLQVKEGPDAIIAHLIEQVPKIIKGSVEN